MDRLLRRSIVLLMLGVCILVMGIAIVGADEPDNSEPAPQMAPWGFVPPDSSQPGAEPSAEPTPTPEAILDIEVNLSEPGTEPTPAPEAILDIEVTPAEDGTDGFTVKWKTAKAVAGWIEYGSSLDQLDGVAFDERGQDVVDTQHQVTVKGLEPGTGYYYVIVSGGEKYDNAGSLFKILIGEEEGLAELSAGEVQVAEPPDGAVEELEVTHPTGVTVTEVRDTQFTVVWETASAEAGWVEYGTSPDKLDDVAFDDRGQDVVDTQHQVTVKGLELGTVYYFVIVSGGEKYDNAGSLFKVLTGAEPKRPGLSEEAAETGQPNGLNLSRPTPPSGRPTLITPFQPVNRDRPQVTCGYGCGAHKDEYWHEYYAVDFALNNRSFPVVAAASGTLTRHDEPGYTGGTAITVFIDHGNSWKTKYAHLANVTVRGQAIGNNQSISVTQGEVIGNSGSTGATANHLHFELRAPYRPNEYPYTGNNTWSYPVPEVFDSDDSRAISSGQTLNGTINPANDLDTYYFDASQGQCATISMNRNNTTLDSYLILYAPNGSEVTRDDDSGGNNNAWINRATLPQSGRYLIVAKSWNGASTGPYSLSLTLGACGGQPPAAPSNTTARALDSSRILVEWNDNSTNENGFVINDCCQDFGTTGAFPGTGRRSFTVGGLAPGTYKCFRVRAFNASGSSGWSNYGCTTTHNIPCPVYRAEYYNNRYLSGNPTFVRCENWPINHNWGNGGPGNGVGNDNFSARWTGRAYIAAGTYTFIGGADDGIKVWLDGNVIINEWRDQGYTEYRVNRSFSSGGNHDIKVEYYENGGAARVFFKWEQQTGCSGSPISLNQTVRGTIRSSGQRDTYCLSVGGGQWISIRMVGNPGWQTNKPDPVLEVYDPGGARRGYNDDGAFVTNSSSIWYRDSFLAVWLPSAGTYSIIARMYGSSTGPYAMRVESGREAAPGDLNRDCTINGNDASIMTSRMGSSNPDADLTLDGIVNLIDNSILQANWGRRCTAAATEPDQNKPLETNEVPQEPSEQMEIQPLPVEPELEPTPSP